jgi:hypothetical protein
MRLWRWWWIAAAAGLAAAGWWRCGMGSDAAGPLILLTTERPEITAPLLEAWTHDTGIMVTTLRVKPREIRKLTESMPPDLIWIESEYLANELSDARLLAHAPNGVGLPLRFRGHRGDWQAFMARPWVLACGSKLRAPQVPLSLFALSEGGGGAYVGMDRPEMQDTKATLEALLGAPALAEFRRRCGARAHALANSEAVARAVAEGLRGWGLCDPDALLGLPQRMRPQLRIPDQNPLILNDPLGAVPIPGILAVPRGSRRSRAAMRLGEFLCAEQTEKLIARLQPKRWSVRKPTGRAPLREAPVEWMSPPR